MSMDDTILGGTGDEPVSPDEQATEEVSPETSEEILPEKPAEDESLGLGEEDDEEEGVKDEEIV